MIQRKRSQGQSGKVQTPNSISILSKILFQILQCLHHVHNIRPSEGIQSKAFLQKQFELDRFVKPAQEVPGSSFRGIYQNLIQRFLINTLSALETHYHQRLDSLEQQITASGFSQLDIQTAYQVAMRWGRRNFGSKLSNHAVESFRSMVRRLESDQSSSPPNSHSNTPPHFSLDDVTHSPNTPVPNPLNPPDPPLTTPKPQPFCQKNLTKPLSKPPSSVTQTSHLPKPSTSYSYSSKSSTSYPSKTSTSYSPKNPTSYLPKSSTSYSPIPSTSYSPKPSTPHSHPSSNTSPLTSYRPTNFLTPPSPSLEPMNAPRNIQGKNDILSNFHPSQLTFRGNSFRSAEQAYQYEKAMFLGEMEVAQSIRDAKDAVQSKHFGRDLTNKFKNTPTLNQIFQKWDMKKRDIMREILWAKTKQVDLFRSELLRTQNRNLTHNLPDRFWGSCYVGNSGNEYIGRNVFAILLMEIRDSLSSDRSPIPSTLPKPLPQRRHHFASPTPQTPPSLLSINPFSPLSPSLEDNFPPLPNPQDPANGPASNPTRRAPQQHKPRSATGPQVTSHLGSDKPRWKLPQCKSKVVVLGDSNLARVTKIVGPVNSIEIHAFHGAKPFHFDHLFTHEEPRHTPTTVILSIGINSRDNKLETNRNQLKRMVSNTSKLFPHSKVYIPQINLPTDLSPQQRKTMNAFNDCIHELSSPSSLIHTIPKLPQTKFQTENGGIHWLPETANNLMSHWLGSLN